jgi:hypothetical protein
MLTTVNKRRVCASSLSKPDNFTKTGSRQTWGKFKKSGVSLGEPLDEICKETAEGSGIFVREWSKATITMDLLQLLDPPLVCFQARRLRVKL